MGRLEEIGDKRKILNEKIRKLEEEIDNLFDKVDALDEEERMINAKNWMDKNKPKFREGQLVYRSEPPRCKGWVRITKVITPDERNREDLYTYLIEYIYKNTGKKRISQPSSSAFEHQLSDLKSI